MRVLRLLPRFKSAYRAVRVLAERERWSRAEIASFQLTELNRIWKHAIQHVAYYRQLRQQRDLPDRFSTMEEFQQLVPLLPKSAVRDNPGLFYSDVARGGCWERTSGSTGVPMSIYHDVAGHRAMQHAKYRLYDVWGIDIFDRSAYLWARADPMMHGLRRLFAKSRLGLVDALRGRQRHSAFNLDPESLSNYLKKLERFRPRLIYGFSNAIYMLAQQALLQGHTADELKAVILTSEVATPRMCVAIENAFKGPVVIEYGAQECEFIAGSMPDGTLRVREDLAFLEAVPYSGDNYELVLSVLTNESFPLLRYRIGDLTSQPVEYPTHGFAILRGGIAGRRDDLLLTRRGGYLHPTSIDVVFEYLIESRAIRRYRVRQKLSGAVEIQIEMDPFQENEFDLRKIKQTIGGLVEGFPVSVQVVDTLEVSASSKFRAITSELTARSFSDPERLNAFSTALSYQAAGNTVGAATP